VPIFTVLNNLNRKIRPKVLSGTTFVYQALDKAYRQQTAFESFVGVKTKWVR
jgi:hypothetical protein